MLSRFSGASALFERAVGIAAVLYLLLLVYALGRSTGIDFDSAYNLEVAQSLARHFVYAQTYQPASIYPAAITSNGPMQYVAALIVLITHNAAVAATLTACAGTLLFASGLYRLRLWLALMPLAFFLKWTLFATLSSHFLGEIWAAGFLVHGIAWLRKDALGWAALAFAGAIATKLLCIALVPLILLAWALPRRAPVPAATIFALSVAGFILQFAFSVLHSNGWAIGGVAPLLSSFVARHLSLGESAQAVPLQQMTRQLTQSPGLLFVSIVGLAGAVLTPATIPLLAATAYLLVARGFSQRELMPFFLAIATLGTLELAQFVERTRNVRRLAPALVACFIALVVVFPTQLPWPFPLAASSDALTYEVQTATGRFLVSPAFIDAIRKQRYVLTSGWWQLPDLSVNWGFTFYDRTWPGAASFPRAQTALLFDRTNPDYPITKVQQNCGHILAIDGPLVLCRPASSVPYAFQPPATPSPPG